MCLSFIFSKNIVSFAGANEDYIEYASIYMGVDTIQIKSKTAIEFDSDLYHRSSLTNHLSKVS